MTPDLVYGRRAVREALRGRREVLEVWATERALKAEDWLREASPKRHLERELSERAATRDHQGVLALVEPYRYADAYELAAAERPLLAVLDRVTDPRNLGAVARLCDNFGVASLTLVAPRIAVDDPRALVVGRMARERLAATRVTTDLDAAILLAVDQPFVNGVMLRQLIQMHRENKKPIVASAYAETVGVPALFDRSCFGDLLQLTGDSGAKGIILARRNDVTPFDFPAAAVDIDTAADYEDLIKSLARP